MATSALSLSRRVDLITGGFPCQPFSNAGLRKGTEDTRHLWPEMLRVISESKPAWVVGENVAGFVSMALDQVCSDLEALGYEVQPFVIPACAVDAPHRRDRCWVVAHAVCEGLERQRKIPSRTSAKHKDTSNPCRWSPEPSVGRMAHGLPGRVDRIKALGNAIVPQVAYQILKGIQIGRAHV